MATSAPHPTQDAVEPRPVRPRRLLTGGQATAEAMRQIDPDVVPVYPITPQTPIIETFAQFVADGRVHTELMLMESEHSAMSAAVGSALAGGRTITATASQGLAYMIEVVYIAASLRAPVVVALGNRALSGPINIHADHSDAMLARDAGAVIMFAENAQEAYDLMVLATRLASDPAVMLPVLVGQDGFTITHSAEPVDILDDAAVREFVGPYTVPTPLLDTHHPVTEGAFAMPDAYFEQRVAIDRANTGALTHWMRLAAEYAELTGRDVSPVESYRLDDARWVLVVMGSAAGTMKDAIDLARARGISVGLLKLRAFRPFPAALIENALHPAQRLLVWERALSLGSWPPLYTEIAGRLRRDHEVAGLVFGLGGRDLTRDMILDVLQEAESPAFAWDGIHYPGLNAQEVGS